MVGGWCVCVWWGEGGPGVTDEDDSLNGNDSAKDHKEKDGDEVCTKTAMRRPTIKDNVVIIIIIITAVISVAPYLINKRERIAVFKRNNNNKNVYINTSKILII